MLGKSFLSFGRIHRFLIINFIVGAIELTLELTATRIAAPYMGLTIYVWTSIIGIILASLALGYLLGGRLADSRKEPMDVVYLLLSSAILIGLINIVKDALLSALSQEHISPQLKALLTGYFLFAAPTVLLGSVSPYLARLSISKVVTSGTQVSRINAAGTFGALFGTFFTGFYLFTLVGTRNILSSLVLLLIITSFLIAPARLTKARLLFSLLALLSLLTPSHLHVAGVTRDFDTAYNRYMIRDVGPIRALQGDSITWQSAVYKNGNHQPYLPYLKVFSAASTLPAQHNNYLVVGGGAFTLPDILERAHPRANIDVVEIDKALLPISEKYFAFSPSPKLHVFTEDGRQYLNSNHRHYDLIYMDAFSNSTPPFQLLTRQATGQLQASLTDGGIVAVNILAAPQGTGAHYIASIARTYRESFAEVRVFRIDKTLDPNQPQSILLLASSERLQPAIDTLAAQDVGFNAVRQSPLIYNSRDGIVLSDDFAPVEQMAAAQE